MPRPVSLRTHAREGQIRRGNHVEPVKTALLICSGPSAENLAIPPEMPVACVNGSFALLKDRLPNWWCVGELNGASHYKADFDRMFAAGVTCLTRQRCIDRCGWEGATPIGEIFGPRYLWPIHDDVLGVVPPMPPDHKRPDSVRPWCTSGVLMLWWLMHFVTPKRIIVAGMDGYGAQEYAKGIEGVPDRPERNGIWVDLQNSKIEQSVCAISNCPDYAGTELVFTRMPRWWNSRCNVKLIDPTPLRWRA